MNFPRPAINERDWQYFGNYRLTGGLVGALRGMARVWREQFIKLTLVNLFAFFFCFSLVGIPAALAFLFFMARLPFLENEITYDAFLYGLRRYGLRSLVWGIPLSFIVALYYFVQLGVTMRTLPEWTLFVAGGVGLGWVGFNFYYWPLWFQQIPEQRALLPTWRKTAAYWRTHPLPALAGVGLAVLLIMVPLATRWFFLPALMLVSLIGGALVATAIVGAYPPQDT